MVSGLVVAAGLTAVRVFTDVDGGLAVDVYAPDALTLGALDRVWIS